MKRFTQVFFIFLKLSMIVQITLMFAGYMKKESAIFFVSESFFKFTFGMYLMYYFITLSDTPFLDKFVLTSAGILLLASIEYYELYTRFIVQKERIL
jgi:hypothetical protein